MRQHSTLGTSDSALAYHEATGEGEWLVHNDCGYTRFIDGVKIRDRSGNIIAEGTVDLKPTIERINAGKSYPHLNDGSTFMNREGRLPSNPSGYPAPARPSSLETGCGRRPADPLFPPPIIIGSIEVYRMACGQLSLTASRLQQEPLENRIGFDRSVMVGLSNQGGVA